MSELKQIAKEEFYRAIEAAMAEGVRRGERRWRPYTIGLIGYVITDLVIKITGAIL